MKKINFVQQTAGVGDCSLACIAMVSGKTLAEVHAAYPEFDGVGMTIDQEFELLNRLDILNVYCTFPHVQWTRVYMVAVPSLGNPGGGHRIVVDCRRPGEMVLLDPARGLPEKKFYGKGGVELRSYGEVIEFPLWSLELYDELTEALEHANA